MLYIRYLIIVDGQSIKKISFKKISIFELPENCISKLCPRPLGTPPQHQNSVKNTQRGAKICFI